jgi:hypothetical protein
MCQHPAPNHINTGVIEMATKQFMKLSKRTKDLTGLKFGRLKIIGPVRGEHGTIVWLCRCSCGAEKEIFGTNLKQGNVESCGCLAKELKTKHGLYKIPEYQVWKSMKSRCSNPNNIGYHRYGGRGIYICKRWWDDFGNFISDMGRRPNPTDTLERIDNNMGYLGANCCWASRKVQNNNTRSNHYITHKGETHTMSEWATITGIHYSTLRIRLQRGWSEHDALTRPVDKRFSVSI